MTIFRQGKMKKEFTDLTAKNFNEQSDVELVEELNKGTYTVAKMNVIMSILNMRSKKVNQYLTELTQKANRLVGTQNWVMIILTASILILTAVMVWVALK